MQVPLIRIASSPAFYVALLAAALLVNAAGYLLALWHERTLFDEAAHLFTSFSLVAAIGRFARGRPGLHIVSRWWALLVVGILLGLAWEAFEWVIGIIGDQRDTIVDLIMDAAGAALAVTLVTRVGEQARL